VRRAYLWSAFLFCCAPRSTGALPGEDQRATAKSSVAATVDGTGGTELIAADDTWEGSYESAAGSLYVVDGGDWAVVRWRGDDASVGLGHGEVSLSRESGTGRIHGTASGPIGDVVVLGSVEGEAFTASILRKDPSDGGLTGTAVGRVSHDQIVGTMRLSFADARVIREARFTLARRRLLDAIPSKP
jgi:hypothetical protein